MKKLITEEEKKQIRNMYSLEENLFSDLIDKVSNSDIAQTLKKIFSSDDSSEESDDIFSDKKTSDGGSKINLGNLKITEPSSSDKDFYEKILDEIGAPNSKSNMAFFYAWRQAEGAKATYNPFNTTQKKDGSTFWNCLKRGNGGCIGGVRNYKSESDGIDATVKTLKNGRYKCIVDGLKNDIGAMKIAECSDLKTWGTGEGVKRVLKSEKINPPEISRSLVKKI